MAPSPTENASSAFPHSEDKGLTEGKVYLESATWYQQNGRWGVLLRGNLPTPCHTLQVSVPPPDPERVVRIRAYSVVASDAMCIQMLTPFETFVALDFGPDEGFQVWVNEIPVEKVGPTQ